MYYSYYYKRLSSDHQLRKRDLHLFCPSINNKILFHLVRLPTIIDFLLTLFYVHCEKLSLDTLSSCWLYFMNVIRCESSVILCFLFSAMLEGRLRDRRKREMVSLNESPQCSKSPACCSARNDGGEGMEVVNLFIMMLE